MARRRFFVESIRGGEAKVEGDDAQHLTRVLRVEAGQRYEICDGERAYLAEIVSARKQSVMFRVIEPLPPRPVVVRLHLYAALIKMERFEWIVEKATEFGAERITAVQAERSERGLERAAPKRIERWRRIAMEASQQSRRDRLPLIGPVADVAGVLRVEARYRFVCDEEPGVCAMLGALPAAPEADGTVAILIGPEGGWTDQERASFHSAGWTAVSLGTQVLRAETAAVAALSVISAAWSLTGAAPSASPHE